MFCKLYSKTKVSFITKYPYLELNSLYCALSFEYKFLNKIFLSYMTVLASYIAEYTTIIFERYY